MEAGRPNDKLKKKRHDRLSPIRHIGPGPGTGTAGLSHISLQVQRVPSDLYLSTVRDITETSVISTLWRLWPGGAHVGYGSVLSLYSKERRAADVKDTGS